SSLVVLWDVMVVNNWHIFLDVYSRDTKGWSKMYFIAWYFTSVLVFMNVFTALILENFIFKWDRRLAERMRITQIERQPTLFPYTQCS
ncbi:putative two-pore calcium channel 2 isoform X2, partial [Apostichopus japonicus]